jgi:hypothetical protein
VLTRFQDDALNVGAVIFIVMGVVVFGPVAHQLRLLRTALRGSRAEGRVETVRPARFDRYGDAVRWVSTVAYWAESDGSRRQVRFNETLGYSPERNQQVPVRYSSARPDKVATIRTPRAVFAKAAGLGVVGVMLVAAAIVWLAGSH